MGTRSLKHFFEPKSIAVFGASEKDFSMGGQVIRNLQDSQFPGKLFAVNIKGYDHVFDVPCFNCAEAMVEHLLPDLAIICSPPEAIPDLVGRLGKLGVKAALVLSGGLSRVPSANPAHTLKDEMLAAARESGIRIMGPECLGILVPGRKLNASYSSRNVKAGKVAYIGQSGMLGNAMIDWANGQGIGFSHVVTLGDSVDVMLPDVIDYINRFSHAQAIILHLESISDARHLMTAVREASRNKLVLAIKSGRMISSDHAPQLVTPGLPNRDAVYTAALNRAGVVRVDNVEELFDALESLSRIKPVQGDRLAIVSNGMGPSILAADKLLLSGGKLATLSEETLAKLAEKMPVEVSGRNPINIGGSATPDRYIDVLDILANSSEVDAVVVLHAPTRMAPSDETAHAVINNRGKFRKSILTCWMGLEDAGPARHEFNLAGVPTYISPEHAVQAFMHMVNYRRSQALLQETPPSIPHETPYQVRRSARKLVETAKEQGRKVLTHQECTQILQAYSIPVAPTWYAKDEYEAAEIAQDQKQSLAVKIVHETSCEPFVYRKHPHKLSAGLLQDINSPQEMSNAVVKLREKVEEKFPNNTIYEYCIQPMQRGKHSMLLNVGITRDPVFGPVILFGIGGYKENVMSDRQVALPPLNMTLAFELIQRSHAYRLIKEHSDHPAEDIEAIAEVLVKLSQIAADIPELQGLEINPLIINRDEMLVVDVKVDLGEPSYHAIMPYPEELRETVNLKTGRVVEVRPIRGEDAPALVQFHSKLSEQSIRFRYFHNKSELTKRDLATLTMINYDRQMAFIAEEVQENDQRDILGVVRVWTDPDNIRTEFSVLIRDDLQGEGLGALLMRKMIKYSKSVGTLEMIGKILVENHPMRGLMRYLGFECHYNSEEQVIDAVMPLNEPQSEWQRHRLESTSGV
ncbi:bifunctional acetate--CoA ligase family protein/GNAT family N-acetyltransferase [Oceanospirillum beijerinckii]|uniref:bifunctional acetate--CoA ligase family protein/GNAT family N-acetyltransferase n=1 Tax=Oceanospirillum beijerinckii TaxID=64976 RepID=UPI000487E526|nr:bifunctional acetate--CoA ligase family protein/GNAT family N-acetyltransferase [Oceanospirillum beijerinckii]MAC46498.1 GNAT family N-acetyltransferase [Oceanospirillum sp.]